MNSFFSRDFFVSKKTLLISTIFFVLFMIIVLPTINWLNNHYIGVLESPDTMLFYSSRTFYLLMEEYGESGRNLYILLRWTFDLVYPLVYGLFFMTLLIYLMEKLKKYYNWMLSFALLAVITDYLENIFSTVNVAIFPKEIPTLVYIMQGASLLKWLFIVFTVISLIHLTFLLIKKHLQLKKDS
ncbi:MAG: hypothetical protein K9L64_00025 [Candidatus Izimaplasma sp.]|nr:hypothetical protein [Candidatus Izimaplasma bacterium]